MSPQHPEPGPALRACILDARLMTIRLRIEERLGHSAFCRRAEGCSCLRGELLRLTEALR